MTEIKFAARNSFFGFFLVLLSSAAQAAGLFAPFTMDSTETLPKGIRNLSVLSFTTQITDAKNGWSNDKPVGDGLNETVHWSDLVTSQKAGYQRNSLQGYVQSKGHKMDESVGNTVGAVDIRVTAVVPVIAYGITDNFTLAVIVPILYSNLNVSTGWSANDNFNQAIAKFAGDGKNYRILQNRKQLENVVSTDIGSKGYAPLQNESRTGMGDMTFAAKYRIIKMDNYAVAIVPKLVLPTGETADVNKLIDVAPGAGVWDLGVSVVQSYQFNGRLSLVQSVGYQTQFTTYLAKRIPFDAIVTTSPDVDDSTKIQLGDMYGGQVGPKYKITELLTVGGAMALQYKAPDVYSGSRFESSRYDLMSMNTEQVMFSGQLGVNFSTVPLYMKHAFEIPIEATLGYANVFSGRNVNTTELYSAALSMFF